MQTKDQYPRGRTISAQFYQVEYLLQPFHWTDVRQCFSLTVEHFPETSFYGSILAFPPAFDSQA